MKWPRTHIVWPSESMRDKYNRKIKKAGYSHSKGLVILAKMYLDGEIAIPKAEK